MKDKKQFQQINLYIDRKKHALLKSICALNRKTLAQFFEELIDRETKNISYQNNIQQEQDE